MGTLGSPQDWLTESEKHIIVLSPHLDDAVFSIGGLLKVTGLHCAVRPSVWTIFAGTPILISDFASRYLSSEELPADIDDIRRVEDRAALKLLNCGWRHFDFVDAVYRDTYSFSGLFGELTQSDFEIMLSLSEMLSKELAELTPSVVISPLGIGKHRDHLIVRQATRCISPKIRGMHTWMCYEEFPYASRRDRELWESSIPTGIFPEVIEYDSTTVSSKIEAMNCYGSQLRVMWPSRKGKSMDKELLDYSDSIGAGQYSERIWWER